MHPWLTKWLLYSIEMKLRLIAFTRKFPQKVQNPFGG